MEVPLRSAMRSLSLVARDYSRDYRETVIYKFITRRVIHHEYLVLTINGYRSDGLRWVQALCALD